jgi:hypothetical protein
MCCWCVAVVLPYTLPGVLLMCGSRHRCVGALSSYDAAKARRVAAMSYEEEDTCMSYEEEDTCC